MKTKEIIKLIESDGWYEVRQKGSHRQYKHPLKKGWLLYLFIAYLTAGLEKSILKQAQLDKK